MCFASTKTRVLKEVDSTQGSRLDWNDEGYYSCSSALKLLQKMRQWRNAAVNAPILHGLREHFGLAVAQ